jgi:hypothetical protein
MSLKATGLPLLDDLPSGGRFTYNPPICICVYICKMFCAILQRALYIQGVNFVVLAKVLFTLIHTCIVEHYIRIKRMYVYAAAMETAAPIVFMVWLRACPQNIYFDGVYPTLL